MLRSFVSPLDGHRPRWKASNAAEYHMIFENLVRRCAVVRRVLRDLRPESAIQGRRCPLRHRPEHEHCPHDFGSSPIAGGES